MKSLRQFVGMINFYRRFLLRAAANQAPLNDLLQGNVKGRTPVSWNPAFEECKDALSQATLITHPKPDAPLAVFTDASEFAIGAGLQQHVNGAWQPLDFFKEAKRCVTQLQRIRQGAACYLRCREAFSAYGRSQAVHSLHRS